MGREVIVQPTKAQRGLHRVPVTIPIRTNLAISYLGKAGWPDTSDILVRQRFLYSGDGGLTFPAVGEWAYYNGKPQIRRDGSLLTEHEMTNCVGYPPDRTPPPWYDPFNPSRRMVIDVEVLQPIDTYLAVDFKDNKIDFEAIEARLNKERGN